jgi:hydroxymethylpyrimidine pyrophosphatase-like HAD family hydrolase
VEVDSFDELPIDEFASLKAFGTLDSAQRIVSRFEKESGWHVPFIKDPFRQERYVVQATHPHVNKGESVKDLKALINPASIVIAAGDDNNDRSMLAVADIKVVMATAPEDMFLNADVIAPPAREQGIIEGLKNALKKNVEK